MNCCLDCLERVVGCHGTCIKYHDFKAGVEKANKLKREIIAKESSITHGHILCVSRDLKHRDKNSMRHKRK